MRTWLKTVHSVWKLPTGRAGCLGVVVLVLVGILGPRWMPYAPDVTCGPVLAPPSRHHLLGTNGLGLDVLSGVVAGCRTSLVVATSVGLGATAAGFLAGAAAGCYPRRVGMIIMRTADVLMTIPRLPLIILLATFMKPRISNVVGILMFLSIPGITRVVRSCVLSLRERDYIRFARFSGGGFTHILVQHLLRESFPLLAAKAVGTASYAITAEAGLSFLGLGDPSSQSLGMMVRDTLDYPGILWTKAWLWWLGSPTAMISFAVLSFGLTGYALEETLVAEEESADHVDRDA